LSSRVVGRGVCPKCGREGSVVLKELSGKIYVYFKHGRKWCYLGSLENVDLSEVIVDLGYHTFTTKFAEYFRSYLEKVSMNYAVVFIIALALLLSAYGISTGGYVYGHIVLTLVILSSLVFITLIAFYEKKYLSKAKYEMLSKILEQGMFQYIVISFLTFAAVSFASMPLTCPLKITLTGKAHSYGVVMSIPLTSIILSSTCLTAMLRPIWFNKGGKYAIAYVVAIPTIFYITLFTIAGAHLRSIIEWLFFSAVMPFAPILAVIAITLAQTYLISLIKTILST